MASSQLRWMVIIQKQKTFEETTYASHDNSMDTVQLVEFFEEKTAIIFYYVPFFGH